jgi:hypothetical protein
MHTIGTPNRETLVHYARIALARPSTPVGQPVVLNGFLATKQRRGIRATSQHQVLYNERRLVRALSLTSGVDQLSLTHSHTHARSRRIIVSCKSCKSSNGTSVRLLT